MQPYRTSISVDAWGAFGAMRWPQAPPPGTIPTMIRVEPVALEPRRAPSWARPSESFREISEGDALFFAGATLAALDSVARSDPPWAGVFRRRLALKSAVAVAQNLLKRHEDEAAQRDAVALAKPGQELGPAGRVYSAFRTLSGPGDLFRPKRLAVVAADLQSPLDPGNAADLSAALGEAVPRGRPAPVVAAAAAAAVVALRADAEPLALLCADAALAKTLAGRRPCRSSPASCSPAAPQARDGGRARARQAGANWSRSLTHARRWAPSSAPSTFCSTTCARIFARGQ
jgi:Protein of unknown function (DUF1403)